MANQHRITPRRSRRWIRGSIKILSCGFIALLLVVGLILANYVSHRDRDRFQAFVDATARWQDNPDFRQVQEQYVTLSYDALQTHPFGVSPSRIILGSRAMPGLPEDIRVNPTSALHYSDFTAGRLTAYMRLCSEQGVDMVLDSLNEMGTTPNLSDARIVKFLDGFRLDWPVAHDAGAIASVRRLLVDTGAQRPYTVRNTIEESLRSHVDAITAAMGWPQDIYRLTEQQQDYVLDHLDAQVKRTEPELWRTKQVSDFLCGIWGQTYGCGYATVMRTGLRVQRTAQWFTPVLAILVILRGLQLRGRSRRLAVTPVSAVSSLGPNFP